MEEAMITENYPYTLYYLNKCLLKVKNIAIDLLYSMIEKGT